MSKLNREFYIGINVEIDPDLFTELWDDPEALAESICAIFRNHYYRYNINVSVDGFYDRDIEGEGE